MRDAFGGLFMSQLMLVFIFIFVSFTAVSLNYAKAFRVKNSIISFLEENEVTDLGDVYNQGSGQKLRALNSILIDAGYKKECYDGNHINVDRDTDTITGFCYNGIFINIDKSENGSIYYNVHTYADWNLGSLNMIRRLSSSGTNDSPVKGTWEIVGQAKVKER